jgi:guanylate kinase
MLFVLSGPSGVGKGTVSKRLKAAVPNLWVSVSWTTRAARPGEVDGVDYRFVTKDEFEAERDAGGFYEWFEVFGDLKGTPRRPVEERLAAGGDVLLEIDVQGALKIKGLEDDAVLIFLMPPSLADLRTRLQGRGTETETQVARRLSEAEGEMAQASEFDHVVVNDDLERVVAEVAGILGGSPRP